MSFWDERYEQPGYLFGKVPNAFLQSQAGQLKPGWHALSLADGEGRNGIWLAEQGLQVHALDVSPVALEKARGWAQQRGVDVHFEHADLLAWTWPEAAYDLVAAIFIQFAGPEGRKLMFDGIRRTLKPSNPAACLSFKAIPRANSNTKPAVRPQPKTCTPKRC